MNDNDLNLSLDAVERMAYKTKVFFRCSQCGKIHASTGVTGSSVCSCGNDLVEEVFK